MILLLITLLDGSMVNLRVPEKTTFHMECKHGKLTIPVGDVMDCSFGVHLDDEQVYENHFSLLGAADHANRALGMKFLQEHKRGAWKFLLKGKKSTDLEVVKRCEQLLKDYDKAPPAADVMRLTDSANISGRLIGTALEGESESLGELKIRFSQIQYVTVRRRAGTVKVDPTKEWQEFGFVRGKVRLTAIGSVDFWPQGPGQYVAGPSGIVGVATQGAYPAGALIGRINGRTFLVGDGVAMENVEAGMLWMKVNQTQWQAVPTGEFEVTID